MSTPAKERIIPSSTSEIKQFGTVPFRKIANCAGFPVRRNGSFGLAVGAQSTIVKPHRDGWEISNRRQGQKSEANRTKVVLLDWKDGRVDFIIPGVIFDGARCVLIETFRRGQRLAPLFTYESTWDLSTQQGRAIALARSLMDEETPQEPVLTYPGGEGGFAGDPVPH